VEVPAGVGRLLLLLGAGGQSRMQDVVWYDDVGLRKIPYGSYPSRGSGEDVHTIAVCGQFVGPYWGESGIPQEWRDGLARPEMIEKALQGLLGGKG